MKRTDKVKATFAARLTLDDHHRVEKAFQTLKSRYHIGDSDKSFLMCCVGIINKEGDLKCEK